MSSKGYEHAIILSNLEKTTETINVLSENNIKGMDELEVSLNKINSRYNEISIRNEQIEKALSFESDRPVFEKV